MVCSILGFSRKRKLDYTSYHQTNDNKVEPFLIQVQLTFGRDFPLYTSETLREMNEATTQYFVLRDNPKDSKDTIDDVYGISGTSARNFESGNFGLLAMAPMNKEKALMLDNASLKASMVSMH